MVLGSRDTLRAAGQDGGKGGLGTERKTRVKGWKKTRVSLSVSLFHMVEPLFKRPITL